MTTVGIVVHMGREAAAETARVLVGWLKDQGVATRSLATERIGAGRSVPEEAFPEGLTLVVSVGGDGTLLRAARLAEVSDVPLLGVNVGRLGFLTEVTPADAPGLLASALDGRARIEERMAVVAESLDSPVMTPEWALNEVMIEKKVSHRMVTLSIAVGGEPVTTFSGDGVVVATPTGSTAYSFSARGPIVSPRVSCLLVTPVSPHMLFDRSIVVPPEDGLVLEVLGDEPGILSADGRAEVELPVGSRIRVSRAERPARLVRGASSTSFFSLLREKFSLPGQAPHVPGES